MTVVDCNSCDGFGVVDQWVWCCDRENCDECGGSQECWVEDDTCPDCGGTGEIVIPDDEVSW